MIDIHKNYRTRDGREVRIYATDGAGDYPVHGAVHLSKGWGFKLWRSCGLVSSVSQSSADLVEVVMLPEYWVVFYDTFPPCLRLTEPVKHELATHIIHHPAQENPIT